MSFQETTHERLDPATRFWTSDGERSTPTEGRFDDVEDDVASAAREAGRRAAHEADDEAARPYEQEFARVHGSVKAGYEWNKKVNDAYRADPVGTREWHRRTYAARLPDIGPEPETKAEAPAHLDERGRDEWERDQAARDAYRSAGRDADFRQQREDAAPIREELRQNFGPLAKFADVASSVHQAMTANSGVADRIARMYGAPVNEAHAAEMVQAAHAQQHAAAVNEWFEAERQSDRFPGLKNPEVESVVCQILGHMTATGQRAQVDPQQPAAAYRHDLGVAYGFAMHALQQRGQVDQEKAATEKAKQASRSLSGGGAGVSQPAPDDEAESVEESVRRAMRASRAA